MIRIHYDLFSGVAKLANDSASTIKPAEIPIRVTLSDNPSTVSTPGAVSLMQFSLCTDTAPPLPLAFADFGDFTVVDACTYTATLTTNTDEINDPETGALTGKRSLDILAALIIEIDGVLQESPSFRLTLQPSAVAGPDLTDGHPVYMTAGYIDTDPTFTANSDSLVPSQKAVKTAIDAIVESSGLGTVLSVGVASANGFSGTVANPTTNPVVTIIAGAITPSSVAATGNVTGANLSGTNTGNQTTITGNAGTATILATPRAINGVNFDGSAAITVTAAAATLTGTTLPALIGTALTALNASNLTSGTVPIARIPTGTSGSTVALGNHTHAFADLTSKPTTLAGYGIVDGGGGGGGGSIDQTAFNALLSTATAYGDATAPAALFNNSAGTFFDTGGLANISQAGWDALLASSVITTFTASGLGTFGSLVVGISGIASDGSVTGSNLSGNNSGDNATNSQYSGLVTNATHTGDATGSGALTLATVNSNVGSFTNGSFTVNAKGLVTAASSGIAVTAANLSGATLNSTVTASSLTSFGASPTLVTPTLGVATATSVNKVQIIAPTTGSQLDIGDGQVFSTRGAFNIFVRFSANSDVTLPTTGTLSTLAGAESFSNKTLVAPILGTPASGNLANCTFPTLNQSTTGNAATVTTNANLTGNVTSVGNATTLASIPVISGANLTTLNASNVSSGTMAIARGGTGVSNSTGSITINGPVSFTGSFVTTGASGTALVFAALGNPTYTFPASTCTLASLDGTETLTNKSIVATQLTGTIADARFPATLPALSGVALTALTAANITASTAAGRAVLNIANPSAISFLKIAADNSVSTRTPAQLLGDISGASLGANTFTAPQVAPVIRLTATTTAYAATITPNADASTTVNIGDLTGALTVAAPTGTPADGQQLSFRLIQDGTGSRVITWNAAFAFGTDIATSDIPTTASAKCEIGFRWNATDSKWRCVALIRGF